MIHRYVVTKLNPEPWAAASFARVKGGKTVAFKNQKVNAYQRALKDDLESQDIKMIEAHVPIHLRFAFWRDSTKGKQADATNLQKSTEDALQGILFDDDRYVVSVQSRIVQQKPGAETGLIIECSTKPFDTPWWPKELPVIQHEVSYDKALELERRAEYQSNETF